MKKIILASQSPQRRALMDGLKIAYEVIPSDIDEQLIKAETQKERARLIALAKAQKIAERYPESVIIAGDTFTFVDGKAHEKPVDLKQAYEMLQFQSGKTGICYSGFAYLDPQNNIQESGTIETEFTFRVLDDQEINKYIKNNPVLTWSAAFSPAYPEGINMVQSLSGSLSSFSHGIPMEEIIPLLIKSGAFEE